jgi:transcriptional regulator GlxA family with amidase domain
VRRTVVCCARLHRFILFTWRSGALMSIHGSFATTEEASSARKNKPFHDLVDQAENLALADVDEPLHIPALCRTLEVSERTLRKAFHRIHGLPPCRHLRLLRLSRARWALLSADYGLTTVTEIAMCFGFVELGRFSVEYRKVFGESPSQTLCRASQTKIFSAANGATSHPDNLVFSA